MTTRTDALGELRPEARLLLDLTRLRLSHAEQERIRRTIAEHDADLDWGFFVDQACRHMVLPLVGRNLVRYRLTHGADGQSVVPYPWIYNDVYEGSGRRNAALGAEYAAVFRQLNDTGVEFAIRKGPVTGEKLYRDPAARRMADLDVLIRPEDFPALEEVAKDLGYAYGKPSRNGRRVEPFDRRTHLYWKANLTNVSLPYIKPGHRPEVEMFILSGCFSLFQPISGVRADADELLRRAPLTTVYGEPARMLDPTDQIIDACVQIHVEATMLYYIESGKNLTIRRFFELAELLRASPDGAVDALADRAAHFGCGDSVYYALHHTAELYPDDVDRKLLDRFAPADDAYLDEYGSFDGQRFRWQHPFIHRMFHQREMRASVDARSSVPGTRSRL